MRSKVVTDSLLQIALLLSLVRSNIDDYLHLFAGYNHESEISDVLLGDASAIVQTNNYHNQWDRALDGFSHPKNIDRFLADFNVQDYYSQNIRPTEIATYLLPEIQQVSAAPTAVESLVNTETSHDANTNTNNNNEEVFLGDSIALQWQADSSSNERSSSEASSIDETNDLELSQEVSTFAQIMISVFIVLLRLFLSLTRVCTIFLHQ